MTVKYFGELYQAQGDVSPLITTTGFPRLDTASLVELEGPFTAAEIRDTVFSMSPLKAPGLDGLQPIFFHSQWDMVGPSVCELVSRIFCEPGLVKNLNETLVVLIPKVMHPESLKNYRPISLCNVIYKIDTNIIATRLKKHMSLLVAPNQCSFVTGRHNSDNVVIAQEVFHLMRTKKGNKGFIAIKVDLEKAYDKL